MLTPADDFPLHQTADPIAFAGTDRNFYDRFFFNGYDVGQEIFFAVALGVYPQLNIMDASFCLLHGGQQINLRASKEMNLDRLDLTVGPITINIIKPLQLTEIIVNSPEHGLVISLRAQARHHAIEEPRFTRRQGARAFMDYTRATQNVSWDGKIEVAGEMLTVTSDACFGTRDRSWGVRPVGMADPQPVVPPMEQQFYWLWTPTNFAAHSLYFHTNDDATGEAWNRRAVLVDHETGSMTHFDRMAVETDYDPTSRRARKITLRMASAMGEIEARMVCKPVIFYMHGLGYGHPEWAHGRHHGPLRVACDRIDLDTAEAALRAGQIHHLHIQALSQVELDLPQGNVKGAGVVEQLFIGPHAPSSFTGLLDRITP